MPNEFKIKNGLVVEQGSSQITGSLSISGSAIISGSLSVTQGITGSLFGTSSWAVSSSFVVSSSFSTSASYATTAQTLLGSVVSSSYAATASIAVSSSFATTASFALNAGTTINTGSFVTTSSFNSFTSSYNTGSFSGSFSGSLLGTSSFASNSISSSYSISSSFSTTASFAQNSQTASYILNAISSSFASTASFVQNAQTASYVLQAVSSSFATQALSSSFASTSSYSKNLQISGSINNVDYIDFNTGSVVTQPTPGRISWNDTDGTLDIGLKGGNVTLQIGQEEVARVVNKTGANLLEADYRVVRVRSVAEGGAQGGRLAVVLAQADNDANSATTLGMVTENIDNNQEGFITLSGQVRKINTTGTLQGETWTDGDVLYLSPTTPGYLTNIKPQAPQHTVIVGYVEYSHINQGKIFIKVDNGYEIDELHNVRINTGSLTSGQLLVRSGSVWVNSNQLTGSYGLTGSLNATSFTGSLFGTASFASNATTSSFAISSSRSVSSSFATTASFALNGGVTQIIAGTNVTITNGGSGSVTINSSGGGGGSTFIKSSSIYLNSGSWGLTGSYYQYTLTNASIVSTGYVDFVPNNSSSNEISTCRLLPQIDTGTGSCVFYSIFQPQTSILGDLIIHLL